MNKKSDAANVRDHDDRSTYKKDGDDNEASEDTDGNEHRMRIHRKRNDHMIDLVDPRLIQQKNDEGAHINEHIQKIRSSIESLLKKGALRGKGERLEGIMKNLGEIGQQLKSLLEEQSPQVRMQQLHALMQKIRTQLNAIDGKSLPKGAERELTQALSALKKTVGEIAASMSRTDKGAPLDLSSVANQRRDAAEGRLSADRSFAPHASATLDTSDRKSSGNNDNAFGFQFLKNASGPARGGETQHPSARAPLFSEQLQQVMENAKIVIRDSKNGSFSMQLHPESLGKVQVNLGLEQGVLTGRFLVESTEAKDLLLGNIEQLREKLADAGVSVGQFNVNVRDGGERFQNKPDQEPAFAHREHPREAGAGYERAALHAHDGAIDMVI